MTLMNLRVPKESAFGVMCKLGSLNCSIQFINLDLQEQPTKKEFYSLLSKCETVEANIEWPFKKEAF